MTRKARGASTSGGVTRHKDRRSAQLCDSLERGPHSAAEDHSLDVPLQFKGSLDGSWQLKARSYRDQMRRQSQCNA